MLLREGSLDTTSFMALIMATFFLASAGASSAYLTVSEVFPMETRALAIAFFYAVGTAIGGISGPLLFGHFVHSGDPAQVATGFLIGAGAMALGGVAELLWGVRAERRSLEAIATPLTATELDSGPPEYPRASARTRTSCASASPGAGRASVRARAVCARGPAAAAAITRPGCSGPRARPRAPMPPPIGSSIARSIGVARALDEHGPCDRAELERILSARHWGPGRLRRALRTAIDEGRCERTGRGSYGPPRSGTPTPPRRDEPVRPGT